MTLSANLILSLAEALDENFQIYRNSRAVNGELSFSACSYGAQHG
jgi:hypothetical protein